MHSHATVSTRAKKKLIFYESDVAAALPMLELWRAWRFIDEKPMGQEASLWCQLSLCQCTLAVQPSYAGEMFWTSYADPYIYSWHKYIVVTIMAGIKCLDHKKA